MKAKKRFGQNFLIEDTIIKKIVSLFATSENDLIIEIGPGRGALTKLLVQKKSQFLAFEIDTDMHEYLDKYLNDRCHIMYVDILNVDLNSILAKYHFNNLYVIGNLPYYITTPIIEKLLSSNLNINEMVFMVQNEVADRLCASSKSSNYGYMSVYVNHYYEVTKEIFVPRKAFLPAPKVDSAVIKMVKKNEIYNIDETKYFSFVKEAFKLKRKTLKNNLKSYNWDTIKEVLNSYELPENVRAEDLDEKVFLQIYNIISK